MRENYNQHIIECIKIIEEQLKYFKETKKTFLKEKEIEKYNKRIENLELIRDNLYKQLIIDI